MSNLITISRFHLLIPSRSVVGLLFTCHTLYNRIDWCSVQLCHFPASHLREVETLNLLWIPSTTASDCVLLDLWPLHRTPPCLWLAPKRVESTCTSSNADAVLLLSYQQHFAVAFQSGNTILMHLTSSYGNWIAFCRLASIAGVSKCWQGVREYETRRSFSTREESGTFNAALVARCI